MNKRYDYGRMATYSRFVLVTWAIVFLYLVYISRSVEGLVPAIALIAAGSIPLLLIHVHLQTSVEMSDQGLVYNGWRKRFSSSWQAVIKIRIMGSLSLIYTQQGNFIIGQMRHADEVRSDRTGGLIKEIEKNAPLVKVVRSFVEFE